MASPRRAGTLAPQLATPRLTQLVTGTPDQLEADADLDGLAFADVDAAALVLRAATVHGCRFTDVSAREADWRSTRLHETVLARLNVPVLKAPRGVWRDVRVEGARLGSVEAYETSWHTVHFVGCKLSFVNLRGAELLDVAFTDCVIEELDLVQATARRVAFRGSRIARLDVAQSTLEHVDLRGAAIEEIGAVQGLKGATIDAQQLAHLAPLLAREQGIKVED